ncbi:MAG: GNAT family N-acetyltransferase [Verrucomicrobia bacterium]|nr:GNAT family N-acetyltransferase [Kiritimatiellia bacterium]MCO6400717.1 GNAT family N-acetyltransferase [Verrucomicrobiota bacterium]
MEISVLAPSRSDDIAELAVRLTDEIIQRTGVKAFGSDVPRARELCRRFMEAGQYTVIAASEEGKIVGFGALCESHSIYAEGTFGILQEFYVAPERRSEGIGSALLAAIVAHAKERGWKRLELCTPPIPEFDATVQFYRKNGFEITGGHKMKRAI